MATWRSTVFELIKAQFGRRNKPIECSEFYGLEKKLRRHFPGNHHIPEKIRQILQELHAAGYLNRVSVGRYKITVPAEKPPPSKPARKPRDMKALRRASMLRKRGPSRN